MGPYEWITKEALVYRHPSVLYLNPNSAVFDDVTRTVTPGSIDTQRSSLRIASLTPLRMTYVSSPSNSTVYSGSVICVTALLLIAPLLGSSANWPLTFQRLYGAISLLLLHPHA